MAYVTVNPAVPTKLNTELVRGTDATLTFVLTDKDGRPVDITLDSVVFTARATLAGTLMLSKTQAAGTHTDPTNGQTSVSIAKAEIDDEVNTDRDTVWLYEVRRIQAGTLKETVHICGELRIRPAVTME